MRRPRRIRIRPPLAAERSYVRLLREALATWQASALAAALRLHRQHPGRAHLRADGRAPFTGVPIAVHRIPVDPHDIVAIGQRVAKQNAETYRRLIGIPTADLGLGTQIDVFRERNVKLIESLEADQLEELTGVLELADVEGWAVATLRAKIEERFEVGDARADLIARDQVLKLNGEITERRQTDAGVERYIWQTSGDTRVRDAHRDLDGTTQRWDDPPVTSESGETNAPGMDFQCRCTAYPLLPGIDDEPALES